MNVMNTDHFKATLTQEGFAEPVTVEREADGFMDVHTHPFEAKALILTGKIHITCGGTERVFRGGDIFHLAANEPHSERYGPEGVTYLVGRK